MKTILNRYTALGLIVLLALLSFTQLTETKKYKCMIQMSNYTGEGAYVIVSLMNPDGTYNKTLRVNGDDDEWYFDISEWWQFYGKRRTNIDAITGATIGGGQRSMCVLEVEQDKIAQGYKFRFETAVEDQQYYPADVEVELTQNIPTGKIEGKGFIRYIRIIPQ